MTDHRHHGAMDTEAGLAEKVSSDSVKGHKAGDFTKTQRVGSAVFFSVSSLMVIFMNKAILTNYNFPHFSFLATIQFCATFTVLSILSYWGKLDIPRISFPVAKEVLPISVMFLGNILCGLGGTRNLSLPMFTVLRRFSILMTMLAEWYILSSKPTKEMVVAVGMMIGGSSIAAFYDFSYDSEGYILVLLNNAFTALNGVYMKRALSSDVLKKNNMAILFYNSVFSAVLMIVYFFLEYWYLQSQKTQTGYPDTYTGVGLTGISSHRALLSFGAASEGSSHVNQQTSSDPEMSTIERILAYPNWHDPSFAFMFVIGALLGSVLNYSIFLCTQYNSALTTAVIGCLKNVATSYLGMLFFPDFIFTWPKFLGINISILGSLFFTYYQLYLKGKTPQSSK